LLGLRQAAAQASEPIPEPKREPDPAQAAAHKAELGRLKEQSEALAGQLQRALSELSALQKREAAAQDQLRAGSSALTARDEELRALKDRHRRELHEQHQSLAQAQSALDSAEAGRQELLDRISRSETDAAG